MRLSTSTFLKEFFIKIFSNFFLLMHMFWYLVHMDPGLTLVCVSEWSIMCAGMKQAWRWKNGSRPQLPS